MTLPIYFHVDVSLMERLMASPPYTRNEITKKYNNRYIVQLTKNYRSHPSILYTSNSLFYDATLEAKANSSKYLALNWIQTIRWVQWSNYSIQMFHFFLFRFYWLVYKIEDFAITRISNHFQICAGLFPTWRLNKVYLNNQLCHNSMR